MSFPMLGHYSHGTAHSFLGAVEGAEFMRTWRLPTPTKIVDKLKSTLLGEMASAEWELLEGDWDDASQEPSDSMLLQHPSTTSASPERQGNNSGDSVNGAVAGAGNLSGPRGPTPFVHLLPTAFVSLTDPCLPRFWSETYRAMAGFVAMIAVFVVVLVEMFFALKGAGHVHGSEYDQLISDVGADFASDDQDEDTDYGTGLADNVHLDSLGEDMTLRSPASLGRSPANGPSRPTNKDSAVPTELNDREFGESHTFEDTRINAQKNRDEQPWHSDRRRSHGSVHQGTDIESSRQNPQRQLLQCLLLEAGILFHSIFIGMALSVATGTSFIVLL
ncbi:hypothetical protein CAN33_0052230 [Aspergillus niger]|uniref:Transmembrane protein n=1 Tax=Aspergillus niger TaxID=5061 RepID=A0A505ICT7_ASPNG|nr:hypothetical protein CAN33_0052230 [Aspergillus niger]